MIWNEPFLIAKSHCASKIDHKSAQSETYSQIRKIFGM